MKIKTSELTGVALDWAVAKCEGKLPASYDDWKQTWPRYATDWAQGGPLIEREYISLWTEGYNWEAKKFGEYEQYGDSVLEAAMRCYVASKLGDEVEVPDELKGE